MKSSFTFGAGSGRWILLIIISVGPDIGWKVLVRGHSAVNEMEVIFHRVILNCNKMDLRLIMEWNNGCGITFMEMYPFLEPIEAFFKSKNYGDSLSRIGILLNSLGYDVKQRKRFKKAIQKIEYDIILDYFLIKNVEKIEKKKIIRRQLIEITEQTFEKYKFEDFDKAAFLKDFKEIVMSVAW